MTAPDPELPQRLQENAMNGATTDCRCHSYNGDFGERPEVALTPPGEIAATRADPTKPIMVDACAADVVQHLWDAGYWTLGSCCGHGGQAPSLVVVNGLTDIEIANMRREIASVDDRTWVLHQWRLIDDPDRAADEGDQLRALLDAIGDPDLTTEERVRLLHSALHPFRADGGLWPDDPGGCDKAWCRSVIPALAAAVEGTEPAPPSPSNTEIRHVETLRGAATGDLDLELVPDLTSTITPITHRPAPDTEDRCPTCRRTTMIGSTPELMRQNKVSVCSDSWHSGLTDGRA